VGGTDFQICASGARPPVIDAAAQVTGRGRDGRGQALGRPSSTA